MFKDPSALFFSLICLFNAGMWTNMLQGQFQGKRTGLATWYLFAVVLVNVAGFVVFSLLFHQFLYPTLASPGL